MRRRAILNAIAAVSGGWIVSACGLPSALAPIGKRTARLGLINASSRTAEAETFGGFLDRMSDLGWNPGDNLVIEERWADGDRDGLARLAQDLASPASRIDVILAGGTAAVIAAKQATSTVPIVMTALASDPVANGIVSNLRHPGGNVTGVGSVHPTVASRNLELLSQVVPSVQRIAVIVTSANPSKPQTVDQLQVAAQRLGVTIRILEADLDDLSRVFDDTRAWGGQALLVIGDAALISRRQLVIERVNQLRLPTIFSDREWVKAGGLMSYGNDVVEAWRRGADYVSRILHGDRPGDLPVELPTTFYFSVNYRMATELGVVFPPDVARQITEWLDAP
jgi:putative ABC transport system substrate-binding protein